MHSGQFAPMPPPTISWAILANSIHLFLKLNNIRSYHSCPGQLKSSFQCCIAKSWLLVRRQDFCCLTPGQLDIQGESLDQMARWRRSIPDNLSVPLTHSPLCILSPWVSNAAQVAISSGFLLTLSNYFLGACLVIRAIHLLPLMDSSSHHCLWTKS